MRYRGIDGKYRSQEYVDALRKLVKTDLETYERLMAEREHVQAAKWLIIVEENERELDYFLNHAES